MGQHISYEQRRQTQSSEPIYIGFDEPQPVLRKTSNLFGSAAFLFGLFGLLSTGVAVSAILTFLRESEIIEPPPFGVRLLIPFAGILISSVAVICAFFGMFKRPRRYAVLGGLMGLAPVAGAIGLTQHFDGLSQLREARRELKIERQLTNSQIREASQKIIAFQKKHDRWPDGLEGNRLVITIRDSWENELRYETRDNGFTIRSAGPDGVFESADDCQSTTRLNKNHLSNGSA